MVNNTGLRCGPTDSDRETVISVGTQHGIDGLQAVVTSRGPMRLEPDSPGGKVHLVKNDQ